MTFKSVDRDVYKSVHDNIPVKRSNSVRMKNWVELKLMIRNIIFSQMDKKNHIPWFCSKQQTDRH